MHYSNIINVETTNMSICVSACMCVSVRMYFSSSYSYEAI